MKEVVIIIIVMLVFSDDTKSQDVFDQISFQISKCQVIQGIISEGNDSYNKVRIKLIETGMLKIFDQSDTLYFLETYNIESGKYYGEIWNNKNKHLTYILAQEEFVFNEPSVFTAYSKKLIEEWDIKSIRLEEETNSTMINPLRILGSRVFNINESLKVDCIKFNEFFLLERDRR